MRRIWNIGLVVLMVASVVVLRLLTADRVIRGNDLFLKLDLSYIAAWTTLLIAEFVLWRSIDWLVFDRDHGAAYRGFLVTAVITAGLTIVGSICFLLQAVPGVIDELAAEITVKILCVICLTCLICCSRIRAWDRVE